MVTPNIKLKFPNFVKLKISFQQFNKIYYYSVMKFLTLSVSGRR